MARDLSVLRHEVEQLATAQEQMTHNIASPQAAQQNIEQNKSPPPLSAVHVPPATQEQMTHNISSPQAAQPDVRQKKLSSPLSPAVRLPPPKNPPGAAPRQPPARIAVLADWWIPRATAGSMCKVTATSIEWCLARRCPALVQSNKSRGRTAIGLW